MSTEPKYEEYEEYEEMKNVDAKSYGRNKCGKVKKSRVFYAEIYGTYRT